ncbi:MAG TPA: cytochrome c oxidase subunit 3 [Thermodesulfobacteriota bacterium]
MTVATVKQESFHGLTPGKVGIWWFLASEIMIFGGLLASFVAFRLGRPEWGEAAEHLNLAIAMTNTVILLTSSLTVALAIAALERGDQAGMRRHLGLTILLGLAFLGMKGVEYTGEIRAGYVPWSGTFWSYYYTMTGLHGLHVLGGIVANALLWATTGWRARSPHRLELAGLYWHFVDVVWIFLFPLLYLA